MASVGGGYVQTDRCRHLHGLQKKLHLPTSRVAVRRHLPRLRHGVAQTYRAFLPVVRFLVLSVVLGTSVECDIKFQLCSMGCGLIKTQQGGHQRVGLLFFII